MYNKNYLVLDQFDTALSTEDYRIEMLKRNSIDGLLDMQIFMDDNIPSFYYDITSKQSLHSYFYDSKLQKSHIIDLFKSLHKTLLNLNKYLLDYDHLVLIPQCIFFNNEPGEFFFSYCPYHTVDFFNALKDFIAYLLTITDHDDEKTVLLSYGLWQETQNQNFNLKSLISIIEKNCEPVKNTVEIVQENLSTTTNLEFTWNSDTNILKEPDVLLKENYTYNTGFLIKNIAIFSAAAIILITNIVLKLLSFYSTELFFVILIAVIVFCIFYTSNMLREAPLYRIYEKFDEIEPKEIIRVNTNISIPNEPIPIIPEADNNETVLLCVNPMLQTRRLIYSGLDFSQEAELNSYPFTIGKKEDCNLIINNPTISRLHARIIKENNCYYLEDLNSSNGTKINEISIAAYTLTEIAIGDTITFADLTYIFQ